MRSNVAERKNKANAKWNSQIVRIDEKNPKRSPPKANIKKIKYDEIQRRFFDGVGCLASIRKYRIRSPIADMTHARRPPHRRQRRKKRRKFSAKFSDRQREEKEDEKKKQFIPPINNKCVHGQRCFVSSAAIATTSRRSPRNKRSSKSIFKFILIGCQFRRRRRRLVEAAIADPFVIRLCMCVCVSIGTHLHVSPNVFFPTSSV